MEKSTKKRVRNVIFGVTSMALVAGITASLTLAYLTDKDSVTNVFTGSEGITAILTEPTWDGDSNGDDKGGDGNPSIDTTNKTVNPDDDIDEPAVNDGWGYEKAQAYMPGDTINKNPQVTNTNSTGGKREYVMLKVTYMVNGAEVSKDDFNKYAGFELKSGWTKCDSDGNSEYYVYGSSAENSGLTLLEPGDTTTPLFDVVNVNTGLSFNDEGKLVVNNGTTTTTTELTALPDLDIKLEAAVVSPTEGESVTYVDVLKALF